RQGDVLAPGQVRMEADAERQQRRDAAAKLDGAGRRREDAGQDPEYRGLPGAVWPDDRERLARLHRDRDIAHRPELPARLAKLRPREDQQALLQEVVAVGAQHEPLADRAALDDRCCHINLGAGRAARSYSLSPSGGAGRVRGTLYRTESPSPQPSP